MRRRVLSYLIALLAAIPADATDLTLHAEPPPAPAASRVHRVLFIGNSLTFANDLPRLVQDIAMQNTDLRVYTESVALPDFSLADHWADGRARQKLLNGNWTLIVMQQGPSAGEEGRAVLREYAKRFGAIARARDARVALYTVWPSRARYGDMTRVIESHRLAAGDAGASVVPVGVAWQAVLRADPSMPLYDRDGFHPSPAGTYLAALVFREFLSGAASEGFTRAWRGARRLHVSDAQAALLERAAHEAVAGATTNPAGRSSDRPGRPTARAGTTRAAPR